jgi:hypothetical protein
VKLPFSLENFPNFGHLFDIYAFLHLTICNIDENLIFAVNVERNTTNFTRFINAIFTMDPSNMEVPPKVKQSDPNFSERPIYHKTPTISIKHCHSIFKHNLTSKHEKFTRKFNFHAIIF